MWRIHLFNYSLLAAALSVPVGGYYVVKQLPYWGLVLVGVVAAGVFVSARLVEARNFIDARLQQAVQHPELVRVYSRSFPKYRFFDLHQACERHAQETGLEPLLTQHAQELSDLLSASSVAEHDRSIKQPTSFSQSVGPDEVKFTPHDAFWLAPTTGQQIAVVRLRLPQYGNPEAVLEVAAREDFDPTEVIDRIVEDSVTRSIYRGRVVELEFHGQSADDFEAVVPGNAMDLRFVHTPEVHDDDIVLDAATRSVLQRTVLDFQAEKEALRALGVPAKRGFLFYGPPGTGKTYTTKYLATKLGITTLVASGSALPHIRAVCNAARTLQPTLVVMEDVDLVFNSRDINVTGAPLGDLMDELDGFSGDDDILFVLTTNAIERVEAAIKDRPGRISQCIHFGAPTQQLRHRYLERLLEVYPAAKVDLDRLSRDTNGCTQAFLKELVYRSVQTALGQAESPPAGPEALVIEDGHFAVAMQEMRQGAGRAGESIIGFRSA